MGAVKLIIGLTGGIGSGKSVVTHFFTELGAPIIDTDQIAHNITEPNTEAYHAIVEHFGNDIITPEGKLDRKKLRRIVFQNEFERIWLEQLLHPLIFEQAQTQIESLNYPYCVLVIPLLVETNSHEQCDRILVVDSPEKLQLKRSMERDNMTEIQAKKILAAQASREQRLAAANDIIVNDANLKELQQQVAKLHTQYLKMAQTKS